jgi:hypothetical protein
MYVTNIFLGILLYVRSEWLHAPKIRTITVETIIFDQPGKSPPDNEFILDTLKPPV